MCTHPTIKKETVANTKKYHRCARHSSHTMQYKHIIGRSESTFSKKFYLSIDILRYTREYLQVLWITPMQIIFISSRSSLWFIRWWHALVNIIKRGENHGDSCNLQGYHTTRLLSVLNMIQSKPVYLYSLFWQKKYKKRLYKKTMPNTMKCLFTCTPRGIKYPMSIKKTVYKKTV